MKALYRLQCMSLGLNMVSHVKDTLLGDTISFSLLDDISEEPAPSSIGMREAALASQTSLNVYQTTWHHNSEYCNLHSYYHNNQNVQLNSVMTSGKGPNFCVVIN
jgi:hypothetical protein